MPLHEEPVRLDGHRPDFELVGDENSIALPDVRTRVDFDHNSPRTPSVRTATVPNSDDRRQGINELAAPLRHLHRTRFVPDVPVSRLEKSTWERTVRCGAGDGHEPVEGEGDAGRGGSRWAARRLAH
jgi:hypothetical protein